jgi:hypothetical protein
MRRSSASLETPPPVGPIGFLELVKAAQQWLRLGAIREAHVDVDQMEYFLTGKTGE